MVVLSHPTGNTFVRAAARSLYGAGWLRAFYTTIAAPGPRLAKWLPAPVRRQVQRRRFVEMPAGLVRTRPWRESVRLAATAFGLQPLTKPGRWASIDAVCEEFDRHVARDIRRDRDSGTLAAVYGYEDASAETFRAARDRNLACVYELSIAYWTTTRRLMREEADRLPAWRPTLRGLDDSQEKLDRKVREIEQADVVVVPSRFVLETLPASIRAAKPCIVAPFGSPRSPWLAAGSRRPGGPFRVLFAGAMTQRKGLADLFAAMRLLKRSDVELVVMGSLLAPMSFYRAQYPGFIYEAPRSHDRVLALMRSCDILALPAIVEGRALVQQEALASGLPLLVTANAGGDDLVVEGRTGYLIPIRSPEALADRIAWLADRRERMTEMRRLAFAKAAETGWEWYETQVRDAVTAAVERVVPRSAAAGGGRC